MTTGNVLLFPNICSFLSQQQSECIVQNKYLDYIHSASKYEGMTMKEKSLNFAGKLVILNVGAENYFKRSELALTASMMSREPKLL